MEKRKILGGNAGLGAKKRVRSSTDKKPIGKRRGAAGGGAKGGIQPAPYYLSSADSGPELTIASLEQLAREYQIPERDPEEMTMAEFAKSAKCSITKASRMLEDFMSLGMVTRRVAYSGKKPCAVFRMAK